MTLEEELEIECSTCGEVLEVDAPPQRNPFTTVFAGDCSILVQPGKLFLVGTSTAQLDTELLLGLLKHSETNSHNLSVTSQVSIMPFEIITGIITRAFRGMKMVES